MEHHLKQQRYGIPLRILLSNGEELLGLVYVQWGQRVRDLLAEGDPFLPFRSRSGTHLINKASLIRVDLLTLEQILDRLDEFPEVDLDYLGHGQW
ncbi:DUF6812 domain-containing protein [Rubellimicrobium arenae]|uniref:DUF6812 domain-containing protein n=1 Tax=Rubellimicrobium arenae TaxID=2817372 RepID=UPI001B3146AE|nr:hypothetical protein [Rubellimicrobium arenae]